VARLTGLEMPMHRTAPGFLAPFGCVGPCRCPGVGWRSHEVGPSQGRRTVDLVDKSNRRVATCRHV